MNLRKLIFNNAIYGPTVARPLGAFLFTLAVALGLWLFVSATYRREELADINKNLIEMNARKAGQISTWRNNQIRNIRRVAYNPMMLEALTQESLNPGSQKAGLSGWIDRFIETEPAVTSAAFLSVKGPVIAASAVYPRTAAGEFNTSFKTALNTGEPLLSDIYTGEDGTPRISSLRPISLHGRLFCILAVNINPEIELYPLLETPPLFFKTAETLLIRKEGEGGLILNDLAYGKGSTLKLKFPLLERHRQAIKAIEGYSYFFEGVDYRGERVFSAISYIEDSNWAILTKIDRDIILAPIKTREYLALTLILLAALLAYGMFSLVLFVRNEAARKAIRRSEAALLESEQIFREFMENSPIYVFFKDDNSRAVRLSRNHEAMLGRPLKELLGKSMYELFPSDTAKNMVADDMRVLKEGKAAVVEEELNGRSYTTTKFPITIADGPRYLAGYSIDITERKRAEIEKDELNKSLIESKQEMENFLYIATHDLRSPLVNIQGFSQNLERYIQELLVAISRTALPGEIRRALDRLTGKRIPEALSYILESSGKMDALITALLKVSRIGRVEMKPETVDTGQVIKRIIASMRYQLKDAAANINCTALPPCKADPLAVSQLFANLLDNAIKYRHKDRAPVVTITGEVTGGLVTYTVADNCAGIPAADLSKVWNVFYKADKAAAQQGEGIGLPMVKRIAEKNGGRIRAESKEGEGSVFYIELPAAGGN